MEIASDTVELLRKAFPEEQVPKVLEMLRQYGGGEWQPEPDRVHRAVVKLGQGDLEQVQRYLSIAKKDYRDVLLYSGDY